MTRWKVMAGCGAWLFAAAQAAAQQCIGLPGIQTRMASVEGGMQFPEERTVLSAGLNGSLRNGAFGGVAVSRLEFDEVDANATALGVRAGIEVGLGTTRTVRFCPVVSATFVSGPDGELLGVRVDNDARAIAVGGSVGGAVVLTDALRLVPYGGLSLLQQRFERKGLFPRRFTDTGALLDVGLGLEINRFLVLRPTLAVPFGFEADEDAVLGVSIALGFGERGAATGRPARRGGRR